jgi:hypothetical protein
MILLKKRKFIQSIKFLKIMQKGKMEAKTLHAV